MKPIMRLVRKIVFFLSIAALLATACKHPDSDNRIPQDQQPDKTKLFEMIKEAEDLFDILTESVDGKDVCESEYWVISTWAWALECEIEAARIIYNKSDASKKEIDLALQGLTAALKKINEDKKPGLKIKEEDNPIKEEPIEEEPVINKAVLISAIYAAEMKKQGVFRSSNGLDIPDSNYWAADEMFAALENAIIAANVLVFDEDASQSEVDAMTAALQSAIDGFVPQLAQVERNDLIEKIEEAREMLVSLQTSDDGLDIHVSRYWVTFAAASDFESEIETAESVCLKVDASQNEINAALQNFISAFNTFNSGKQHGMSQIDKYFLRQAINSAEAKMVNVLKSAAGSELLNSQIWASAEMFAALETAIEDAEELYRKDYAGMQDDVDAMVLTLQAAIGAFVPQPGLLTSGGISYVFTGPQNETITLTGAQTLSWVKNNTLTISVSESFDSYQWYVDGKIIAGAIGKSITLKARDFSIGTHTVTLHVTKNSVPGTKTLYFSVE